MLTEEQKRVVMHYSGPALVLAGAGSGKSTTLIQRTVALVDGAHGPRVRPARILLSTFSKKAATDLQKKLEKALPGAPVKAQTLHSLGMGVMTEFQEALPKVGYRKGFKVRSLAPFYVFKDMFQKTRRDKSPGMDWPEGDPAEAARYAGLLKRQGFLDMASAQDWLREREVVDHVLYSQAFGRYEAEKRRENVIDFDDMLLIPKLLMEGDSRIAERFSSMFDQVMIDECQDSNEVQTALVGYATARTGNIVWVGDDFQAIYGFTGATPETVIYRFKEQSPDGAVYQLSANFRCQANVVNLANNLIGHMVNPFDKKVVAAIPAGPEPELFSPETVSEEAAFVVQNVVNLTPSRGRKGYSKHAVLYRKNAQSRAIEDQLIKARIPYVIHGGDSFYSRKEVKEMLAFLRVSVDPEGSNQELELICNIPSKRFGSPTHMLGEAFKRDMQSDRAHGSLWGAYLNSRHRKGYQIKAVNDTARMITEASKLPTISERLRYFADEAYIGWIRHEYGLSDDDGDSRLDLIEELISSTASYGAEFDRFFDFVRLIQNQERLRNDPDFDGVNLLTIHKSKGLEWDFIHLIGLSDGTLPLKRRPKGDKTQPPVCQDIEEERRLCYVAVTRAAKRLFLYCPAKDSSDRPCEPSQFIEEMGLEFGDGESEAPQGFDRKAWAQSEVQRQSARQGQGLGKETAKRFVLSATQSCEPF